MTSRLHLLQVPGSLQTSVHPPCRCLEVPSNCRFGSFIPAFRSLHPPGLASELGVLWLPIALMRSPARPSCRASLSLLPLLPSAWRSRPPREAFPAPSSQTQKPPPLCSLGLQGASSDLTPNDFLSSALVETPGWGGWCWEVRGHNWEREWANVREENASPSARGGGHVAMRPGVAVGLSWPVGLLGLWTGPLGRWQPGYCCWLHTYPREKEGERSPCATWFHSPDIAPGAS